MVNRDVGTPGQGTGHAGPHQQGADQAGTGRIGHAIDVLEGQIGFGQGLSDQRQQLAHVVAAGQFRHNAAVLGMQGNLAVNRVGTQSGRPRQARVVHGHAGFIAGSFNTQDAHRLDLGVVGQDSSAWMGCSRA